MGGSSHVANRWGNQSLKNMKRSSTRNLVRMKLADSGGKGGHWEEGLKQAKIAAKKGVEGGKWQERVKQSGGG